MKLVNLRKWTVYGLVAIAILAGISGFILFAYFHNGHLPNYSQQSIGRVYESNMHGFKVYLTKSEHHLLRGLEIATGVAFVVAELLNRRWRDYVNPSDGLTYAQRYNIHRGRPPYLQ